MEHKHSSECCCDDVALENAKLLLQVGELQKAVEEMLDEMRAGGTPEFFKAKMRVEALIEKAGR